MYGGRYGGWLGYLLLLVFFGGSWCVLLTVQVLGFGEYIEEVYAAYEQHKLETLVIIFPSDS